LQEGIQKLDFRRLELKAVLVRLLFAVLTAAGAFLSFEIQPLAGKIVTASFGGSAAIWGVCLLFFQAALLGGYLLTFLLTRTRPVFQSVAYALMALLAAVFLNLPAPGQWGLETQGVPVRDLLFVLSCHLALPCLLLSSISGMIQTWFNLARLGNPYLLYSLSNAGSLAALLAYPLVIEPSSSLTDSIAIWRLAYLLLSCLILAAAGYMFRARPAQESPPEVAAAVAPAGQGAGGLPAYLSWIALSALGTLTLVSYTAYLTQDIAPVPLIYVIPLCLYLVSFIIAFAGERFYPGRILIYLTPLLWLIEAAVSVLWVDRTHETSSMLWSIMAVLAFMFSFFLTCQGELYAMRPPARHLAAYYLAIAAGGTLGGVIVNFAAPALFNTYMERYIVGAFAVVACAYVACSRYRLRSWPVLNTVYATAVITGFLILSVVGNFKPEGLQCQKRNFFGCLSVLDSPKSVTLENGRIMHGRQLKAEDCRRRPTLYYGRGTGLGLADLYLRNTHEGRPLKYGLVGLGAGTIAAYARPGDRFVFYEIDPKVIACAREYFSFLADCGGTVTIIAGDARKRLSGQAKQEYNLLVVDAFNGDAIPVHLLTRESMNLYFNHLVDDGILLVHVTNRFIDLKPVLGNLAATMGLQACLLESKQADYVALSRQAGFKLSVPSGLDAAKRFEGLTVSRLYGCPSVGVWTDDYSNVLAAMLVKLRKD
jgi:hypothetical protein